MWLAQSDHNCGLQSKSRAMYQLVKHSWVALVGWGALKGLLELCIVLQYQELEKNPTQQKTELPTSAQAQMVDTRADSEIHREERKLRQARGPVGTELFAVTACHRFNLRSPRVWQRDKLSSSFLSIVFLSFHRGGRWRPSRQLKTVGIMRPLRENDGDYWEYR